VLRVRHTSGVSMMHSRDRGFPGLGSLGTSLLLSIDSKGRQNLKSEFEQVLLCILCEGYGVQSFVAIGNMHRV
jgi:hypothetical protein